MASVPTIIQVLAVSGVINTLRLLSAMNSTALPRVQLQTALDDEGIPESEKILDACIDAHLLQFYGPELGLSRTGLRVLSLVDALEGADIDDVYRQLRRIDGRSDMYELVREGMTSRFMNTLIDRPAVRRLYLCSPWVNPSKRDLGILRYTLLQAHRGSELTPELLVMTRPRDHVPRECVPGIDALAALGATIYFHPRLHSKLYIREPGPSGGILLAIVGSQNLTRANNLELGIQINGDTHVISQLIQFFWHLTSMPGVTADNE